MSAPTVPTAHLLDSIQTNGGFTWNPNTDTLIEVGSVRGYAIAIPGTERLLTSGLNREEFANAFAQLMTDPQLSQYLEDGAVVGGWYSPERDLYMVELADIWDVDREHAIMIGEALNQEAVFNLCTGEEISTGGLGDATPHPTTTP